MTDSRLQQLKRAWEASGAVEDEAAWLRERVRMGELSDERLRLAAYLRYAPAVHARGEVDEQAGKNLLGVLLDLRQFGRSAWLAAAVVIASKHYGPTAPTPKRLQLIRDGQSVEDVPSFGQVMHGTRFVLNRNHVDPAELQRRVLQEVAVWALASSPMAEHSPTVVPR